MDQRKPLVLLAGLPTPAVEAVANRFACEPGTVVLHHDLRSVHQGVVRRRLRCATSDATEILELAHGCVSCTLREDLLPLLLRLAQRSDVLRIVLHLDQALEPEAVCWAIQHVLIDNQTADEAVDVEAVLAVIDRQSWLADATGDEELIERQLTASSEDDRTVAQLVIGQVEFADLLLLAGQNSDAWTWARTQVALDRLAPQTPKLDLADFCPTTFPAQLAANARRGRIDDAHAPLLASQPPLQADCGIDVVVFSERRPFHPQRLHEALDVLLGGVIRARGRIWIASQPNMALCLESAGGGLRVGHAGPWLAALAPEQWAEVDAERRAMANLAWDAYYGDRMQEIVVITHLALPSDITEALQGALLTDQELSQGQDEWVHYPDPFGSWHTDPCAGAEGRNSIEIATNSPKDES